MDLNIEHLTTSDGTAPIAQLQPVIDVLIAYDETQRVALAHAAARAAKAERRADEAVAEHTRRADEAAAAAERREAEAAEHMRRADEAAAAAERGKANLVRALADLEAVSRLREEQLLEAVKTYLAEAGAAQDALSKLARAAINGYPGEAHPPLALPASSAEAAAVDHDTSAEPVSGDGAALGENDAADSAGGSIDPTADTARVEGSAVSVEQEVATVESSAQSTNGTVDGQARSTNGGTVASVGGDAPSVNGIVADPTLGAVGGADAPSDNHRTIDLTTESTWTASGVTRPGGGSSDVGAATAWGLSCRRR